MTAHGTHTVRPRRMTDDQGDEWDMFAVYRPDGTPARMTQCPTAGAPWRPVSDRLGARAVFGTEPEATEFARRADRDLQPFTGPIAATEAELRAAEAVTDKAREAGAVTLAAYHNHFDANAMIEIAMAREVLDVFADGDTFATAHRVIATVDLLLTPELDRHETADDGQVAPMRCQDCRRPAAYDHRDDRYRHLVAPERGCFLIPAEKRP